MFEDNDPQVLELYLRTAQRDDIDEAFEDDFLDSVGMSFRSPEALRVLVHFLVCVSHFQPYQLVRAAWHPRTIEILTEFPEISFNRAKVSNVLYLAALGYTSVFQKVLTNHVTEGAFFRRLVKEIGESFLESGTLQRIIYAILTTPFRDPSILQLILHEISAKKSLCVAIARHAPRYFEAIVSAVDDPTIFRNPESAEVSDIVEPLLRRWSPNRAAFAGAVARAGAARAAAQAAARAAAQAAARAAAQPQRRTSQRLKRARTDDVE
jgi:hypothetical protein